VARLAPWQRRDGPWWRELERRRGKAQEAAPTAQWLGRGPADDLDSGPQERPRHTGHRETGPPLPGRRSTWLPSPHSP